MYWLKWGRTGGEGAVAQEFSVWYGDVPETSFLVMVKIPSGGRMCNCDGIKGTIIVDEESGNWEHFWNVFFLGFREYALNTPPPPLLLWLLLHLLFRCRFLPSLLQLLLPWNHIHFCVSNSMAYMWLILLQNSGPVYLPAFWEAPFRRAIVPSPTYLQVIFSNLHPPSLTSSFLSLSYLSKLIQSISNYWLLIMKSSVLGIWGSASNMTDRSPMSYSARGWSSLAVAMANSYLSFISQLRSHLWEAFLAFPELVL